MSRSTPFLAALAFVTFARVPAAPQQVAPTPPLGWNSWDAYGLTIDEADYRANVQVLASLKQYGWKYAVIDEGWYMQDPFADKLETKKYVWDANGNLIPAVSRFPSSANGAGFKPLSDWVHAQGLKFGIHIIRGIPKQVVKENLPIAGTSFHAQDAADIPATCPWDDGNYGVSDTPAGQAYFDGMFKLFAAWGLDYVKVDCVSDHPYRPTEIRQIAEAIRKTGRPMVLSLSPGPTAIEHAAEVSKYAQMWRITDDHWDYWLPKKQNSEFPFGLSEEFDRIAKWNPYVKPGSWPDPDMLPEGSLMPHPGEGQARISRYTHDEQRTEFTLWAISRSPLIFGGNLTKVDDFTRSLLTNGEVLEINQKSVASGPALMPMNDGRPLPWRAWYARTAKGKTWLAVFNTSDQAGTWEVAWLSFHLADQPHAVFDIYNQKHLSAAKTLHVELPPHGCALFRVE
ncbi:MAG TPA: glycoside hydrolase family 27 protein [Terracidiphilus sp.]|jgi:hypothetical protein